MSAPVRGRWAAINSPGQKLPSHGTRTRGQYAAVDLCGADAPDDPPMIAWALRGSRPEAWACFGAPIHAMAAGAVVAVRDGRRDHRARNTGNTSMPHLHVHLMDAADPNQAAGLLMSWPDAVRTGDLDPRLARWAAEPEPTALSSMPRNGEVIEVR